MSIGFGALFWLIILTQKIYFCNSSNSNYYDEVYDDLVDEDVVESQVITPIISISNNKLENKITHSGIGKSDIEHLSNTFRKIISKIKWIKKLDIVFLIDASSSVGKENFQNEISFVKRLLTDFNVSLNFTRVAIISFSSAGKITQHVNQISESLEENDKCMLLNFQIPKIVFSGGGTYTYGAFLEAQKIFSTSIRNDSRKVIFLITDGFSNGQNPVDIAQQLKEQNVTIFSIGISSGNYDELFNISSKPKESFFYMLNSFALFESLARKALHTDYRSGEIVPIANQTYCDLLCKDDDSNITSIAGESESCCDENAECACGHYSGHYSCICKPGYYGSGLKGSCEVCPNGTYWNEWNSCLQCPDINHETLEVPALNISGCTCKKGYTENSAKRCDVIKCPLLKPPENGYFVKHSTNGCGQVLNTACGARCISGFQLQGSSIRLCQENGTWSGIETMCVLKTCPSLLIPPYSNTICKNPDLNLSFDYTPRNTTFLNLFDPEKDTYTEQMPIDTECVFKCGHGYYMSGSSKRNCLPVSLWDGLVTACKPILCPALKKTSPYLIFDPPECAEQKMSFGSNCSVSCEFGFELKGPMSKACGGKRNGVWSQKTKNPKCVDSIPPHIICPDNYTLNVLSRKNYLWLNESNIMPLQYVHDNSNNVSYWLKPAVKEEGVKIYMGNHQFTYVAVDDFKNKAKCNFTISVIDTTPPVLENCVTEQIVFIPNKVNTEAHVEWEEPNAYDNVDDRNVTIIRDLEFGFLNEGQYKINYTIADNSGNINKCVVHLDVKVKKCDNVEKPQNGLSVCAKNSTHTWCDLRCNVGYALIEPETSKLLENLIVYCDNDNRTWNFEEILECSKIEQPSSVEEVLSITLESDNLSCEDYSKETHEEILKNLKEELCHGQDCEFTSELPICDLDPEDTSNLNDTFYRISKREISTLGPGIGGIKINKQRTKNMAKVNLYISLSKKLGMWKQNGTRSENIKNVKEELKNLNTNEKMKKRLRSMNLDMSQLKLDELIKCNNGSIVKNLSCVQCPRGTYHDFRKSACVSCPFGTYNSFTGSTSCITCPENFSTRKTNSKLESDCKKTCPPGTISRIKAAKNKKFNEKLKTLMPFCKACPIGEYNNLYDQLECLKCPIGFTSRRGSSSLKDCTAIIEKSPCSLNPCGAHGQCVESGRFYHCNCYPGFMGSHCEFRQNACLSDPCQNGGVCKYFDDSSLYCDCPSNFNGTYCENYIDPCKLVSCANQGTCVDVNGQAVCECSSDFGDSCDQKFDPCQNDPCVTGTCLSYSNSYSCVCPAGTMGKRCHLTPCDNLPCPNNAVCENLMTLPTNKESYRCNCLKGYKGKLCNEIDSPCNRKPCKNDATCIPKLLRSMVYNISEIQDDNIFEEYKCKCPPFFYGINCEKFTTPDFVMEFEKSSINNYVKLNGPSENLDELSFCAWIQTKDTFNYGSLLSYATPELDNTFTFTDYNGFVLYINGNNTITDIKIIDDIWHFICVSWTSDEGFFEIYLDGYLHTHGFNLSKSKPVAGNGVFIIGQEQDVLNGGFSETESFVGKIGYMDFWSRTLSGAEVYEFYRTCEPYQGNLFSWTDMKFNVHGNIKISRSEFCKPCDQNLTLRNGIVMYSQNEAYFKCNEGFNLQGSSVVYCLRTSKWENTLPTCKLIRCGSPKIPANGRALSSKTSYNGRVKFFCDDGFLMNGSDYAICTLNGTWSNESPTCKSIIQCDPLKPPLNGQIVYASDFGKISETLPSFHIGVFAEVKCNPGYQVDGENLITCLENGNWDGEIEDCEWIPTTSKIQEITTTEETSTVTATEASTEIFTTLTPIIVDRNFWKDFKVYLYYSCSPKNPEKASKLCNKHLSSFHDLSEFELPESDEYRNMDSKLSGMLTDALNDKDLQNINVENFFEFLLYGSEKKREKINELSENAFRLVVTLYIDLVLMDEEYGAPEKDENINDKVKIKLKRILEIVQRNKLEDDQKQKTKPQNAIQALISSKYGEVDANVYKIEEKTCKVQEILLLDSTEINNLMDHDGNVVEIDIESIDKENSRTLKIGSIVNYICAKNHKSLKSLFSVCQNDGKWSPVDAKCELITCPAPKDGASASSKKIYSVGDKIKINCKEGYAVQGNPFIQCLIDGKWSKIQARCTRLNCLKPKISVNANIVAGSTYYYKDKLVLRCKNGDIFDIECRGDTKWFPEPSELC